MASAASVYRGSGEGEAARWISALLAQVRAAPLLGGRGDPSAHPAVRALLAHPPAVVWIYARALPGDPHPAVSLGREDGRLFDLPVKQGGEDAAMTALARLCPRATLGFTPERALAFHKEPRALRLAEPEYAREVRSGLVAAAETRRALLPSAARAIRRARVLHGLLGAAFLVPGALGLALALAAARGQERLLLASVFAAVAVLPGLLLCAAALRPLARHPLHRALSDEPEKIAALYPLYASDRRGDRVLVVEVRLRWARWRLDVPQPHAHLFA
jgi:hypothetical protein